VVSWMTCSSDRVVATDALIRFRVALIRHPEAVGDPFRLSALCGLPPDQVQALLLQLPSEEEIEEWEQQKLDEIKRMNTPDPLWLERSTLEQLYGDNVE